MERGASSNKEQEEDEDGDGDQDEGYSLNVKAAGDEFRQV